MIKVKKGIKRQLQGVAEDLTTVAEWLKILAIWIETRNADVAFASSTQIERDGIETPTELATLAGERITFLNLYINELIEEEKK